MKNQTSTRDFPQWLHRLVPMGPRSVSSLLAKVRPATLAQIETHLGPFLPTRLFPPSNSGPYSRERIFTLSRTFWCFLWQMLQGNTALREVVRQVQALFQLQNGPAVDEDTGGYSQARSKLPLSVLEKALGATAQAATERAPNSGLLGGRPVKVVDGSSVRLADTPANQRIFPQRQNQTPGCGFPILRVVVLFCAASGAILARRIGSFAKSEAKLFSALFQQLKARDIVIGDRYYANFTMLALFAGRGIDFVGRVAAGSRRVDFRRAQRLGKNDGLFVWRKNSALARWLSARVRASLPLSLTVRIVRVQTRQKGFRSRSLILVTTLLDPKIYSADEIAKAYLRRWRLEMCLDDLKTTLHLAHLKCLTPKMANKELLMGLIAHNLLRCVMAQAAQEHAVELDRISLKGSMDTLRQFSSAAAQAKSAKKRRELWDLLLKTIAVDLVPERPGRREPRAVKLVSKYPKLTRPRHLQKDRPPRTVRRSLSKSPRAI